MINIKKIKVNPINNCNNRFNTCLKTYKRLLIFIIIIFIIISYITGKTFDTHFKEDLHIYTTN